MTPYIVGGITVGAVYAIAALGLVITYKTSGVFNFGQGAVAAFAAYFFFEFWVRFHFPWIVAALLTIAIAGIGTGLVLERMAAYLTGAPPVLIVVATVGILVAVEGGEYYKYNASALTLPSLLNEKVFTIGGFIVPALDVITVAIAIVTAASLYFFFQRSRLGAAMVAVVDDPDLLSLQGINPATVRRAAWILGQTFTAISGILIAPSLGVAVPELLLLAIAAFGAAAVGAFSNLPLTLVGAFGLGIAGQIVIKEVASSSSQVLTDLPQNLPFIVLFAVLVFVPSKYFPEFGSRVARRFRPIRQVDAKIMAPLMGAGLVILCILPFITIKYYISPAGIDQYTAALAYAMIFMSLGLITWLSGQISLCQIAFAAIGATTSAHLLSDHVPWLFSILLGGLICIPVAAVVAIPANRLSGIYVAILTFGFGILVEQLFYTTFLMFGQTASIPEPRPHFLGLGLSQDRGYYFVVLLFTVLTAALIIAIRKARLGRLLGALSDSPVALDAHGTNTKVLRVTVFCISAFIAGVGGTLLAGVPEFAAGSQGQTYDFTVSLILVAVLAICGRRPISSAFLAAFLFEVIKVYPWFAAVRHQYLETLFFGCGAIVVACAPGISAGRSRRLADRGKFGSLVGDRMSAIHDLPIQPARPVPSAMYRNGGNGNGNGHGGPTQTRVGGPIQPAARVRSTTEVS